MAIQIIKNRLFRTIAIGAAIIFTIILILQFGVKKYIINFLDQKIPDHIHLVHGQIEVNLLTGFVQLQDITLELRDRDSGVKLAELHMKAFNLEGFGYFNYFFRNNIGAKNIKLLNPKIGYYSGIDSGKINFDLPQQAKTGKSFTLARLEIVDGELVDIQKETDTIKFMVEKLNLSVENLKTDKILIEKKIPFSYGAYTLSTGKIFVDLGPYEALTVRDASIKNEEVELNNVSLKSKYTKVTLSEILEKERDHIDLKMPVVKLSKMEYGFNADRFFLKTNSVHIQNPICEIYRDKLIQDDWVQKKLYSRKLREMPMDLDISEVIINKGHLSYAELVNVGTLPGELVFSDLEARLNNVSNTYENGETTMIEARALLMGNAPIQLQWNFDSSKENDAFYVSGMVKDFESESINQFLKSNLRTKAEGDINELYFTVSGDAISSRGDMKMKYRDFRFMVLKKDRLGVNKFLTFIGNMITNDGSKTDDRGYRYGVIYAERDTTKSFFNYLWNNVMDGILNTLTGDGKKE
ncbi:hypothetical protein MWU78_04500 [Arenibacter sp. F26102]|uniref:hypothetical protein n=1 Tax=Arenibacter sp. F26102 TaxID=2926416 RepID=UPI001FF14A9C|nr:hypothetical protein [Arenibacter sp. F26102]MCK0144905.1 hypothetical protein [Arenibacter sp. F26102]